MQCSSRCLGLNFCSTICMREKLLDLLRAFISKRSWCHLTLTTHRCSVVATVADCSRTSLHGVLGCIVLNDVRRRPPTVGCQLVSGACVSDVTDAFKIWICYAVHRTNNYPGRKKTRGFFADGAHRYWWTEISCLTSTAWSRPVRRQDT